MNCRLCTLAVFLITSCRTPAEIDLAHHDENRGSSPAAKASAIRQSLRGIGVQRADHDEHSAKDLQRLSPRSVKIKKSGLPKTRGDFAFAVQASSVSVPPQGGTVSLRVHLVAPRVRPVDRPALNLALVFDTSGSMNAREKVGYLRDAAHLLVDQLLSSDRVALVTFNKMSHLLIPSHEVVNREYLHHRIDELLANGWTNLSAGLLEGYAQAEIGARVDGVPGHVIVLTDGLANRGITDPGKLAQLVQRKRVKGMTLTSLGVGTEFDETLLSRLAKAGGGRYVYIRRPEEIPGALRDELGSLLEVFAQNLRLKVQVSGGGRVQRVYGAVLEDPVEGFEELSLGDMAAGDERSLLLTLHFPPAATGHRSEVRCSLVYDLAESGERALLERVATVETSSTPAPPDTNVKAYARLVLALNDIQQAVEGMDHQLANASLKVLEEEYTDLKEVAFASGDQDLVNKAFLFFHFATELREVMEAGLLHGHSEEREQLKKDLHYRRYLLQHHREGKH